MIIQEDLSATLDEPAEIVVIHRVEPTRLQSLALQLTDKLKSLAENLDQVLEPRTGKKHHFGWFCFYPHFKRCGHFLAPGFTGYRQQNWYNQNQKGGDGDRRGGHGGGGGGDRDQRQQDGFSGKGKKKIET